MPQKYKELSNPCEACGAKTNMPCVTGSGRRADAVHSARMSVKKAKPAEKTKPAEKVIVKEEKQLITVGRPASDKYESLNRLKKCRQDLMSLPVSKFTVRELWYILAEPELETVDSRLSILEKIWEMNSY